MGRLPFVTLLMNFRICPTLNNYMVFNDSDGVYTYTFEYERKVIGPR